MTAILEPWSVLGYVRDPALASPYCQLAPCPKPPPVMPPP